MKRHDPWLAADNTMTMGVEPLSADDIFLRGLCDAELRERMFGVYPEVSVYYEHALDLLLPQRLRSVMLGGTS